MWTWKSGATVFLAFVAFIVFIATLAFMSFVAFITFIATFTFVAFMAFMVTLAFTAFPEYLANPDCNTFFHSFLPGELFVVRLEELNGTFTLAFGYVLEVCKHLLKKLNQNSRHCNDVCELR